ncbi:MAG: hypothetical protein HOQ05_00745 [Corynebacteriales bacterium]|nr:hypothetical protein [Mycobacteriales bacterium]
MYTVAKSMARSMAVMGVAVAAALAVLLTSNPASADGSWSNHQTTIISRDAGLYIGTLEVAVWTQNIPASYHARVWGPGFSVDTKSEYVGAFRTYRDWVKVDRVFAEGAVICAEGWRYNGHGYDSIGLPCFTVTRT